MRKLTLPALGALLLASSWIAFYCLSIFDLSDPGSGWLLLKPAITATGEHYIEIGPNIPAAEAPQSDGRSELTLASLSNEVAAPQTNQRLANRAVTSNGTVLFVHEFRHFDDSTDPRAANESGAFDGSQNFASKILSAGSESRAITSKFRPQLVSLRFNKNGGPPQDGACISNGWWHDSFRCQEVGQAFSPQVAADSGSKCLAGHVYCVWADGNHDGGRYIFFSSSSDHGANWSRPSILSERFSETASRNSTVTVKPSIVVNREGVVAVSWFQHGSESDGRAGDWQLRFRASLDGGNSWLASVQVNQESIPGMTDVAHAGGITATPDGQFHATWIDDRTSTSQLQTAAVAVKVRM